MLPKTLDTTENKLIEYIAKSGGAFQKVEFHGNEHVKSIPGIERDKRWSTYWGNNQFFTNLLAWGIIETVRPWYVKLTPEGVKYCKDSGFYLSTRAELLYPQYLKHKKAVNEYLAEIAKFATLLAYEQREADTIFKQFIEAEEDHVD